MADIEIITTDDGSHTLRNKVINETFHSVHGAIRESSHVFIDKGLAFRAKQGNPSVLHILEVGFGTGLNALLTAVYARESTIRFHYTTLESNPLEASTVSQLNYPQQLGFQETSGLYKSIHSVDWEQENAIASNFVLRKLRCQIEQSSLGMNRFDLVYFDAFAPSKQPEIWDLSILQKVSQSMGSGAVFVTYCAQGQLKRNLRFLGLQVETLPGPPGKKEMVRALKS